MSSMFTKRAVHLACFAVPLALAFSCKVENKDDYTFTDEPPGESGGSSGRGGSSGKGGSGGSSTAGKGGSAGSGAEAGAGSNEAGAGGSGGASGANSGGESGSGGEGGETILPPTAGQGGEGGEGGEIPIDPRPCVPDPCIHGICVAGEGDDFTCDCDAGYSGDLCEINTDDCSPNPCQNGGLCADGIGDYDCDCAGTGYIGATCELPEDECLLDPCACAPCAHGTCVSGLGGVGTFTCDCGTTGYEGTYCENDINDCAVNPCQNGGRCVDTGPNSYSCDCRGTYHDGELCTKPLCGNGTLDPGEETDSTRSGTKEVPVNPVTCRFDFSRITQWFCADECGYWGDKKPGCQQLDADAFCRLKMDDPKATAEGFQTAIISATAGVCCPSNPKNLCTELGNFARRGVDLTVSSTANLYEVYGRFPSITDLRCTGERGGL